MTFNNTIKILTCSWSSDSVPQHRSSTSPSSTTALLLSISHSVPDILPDVKKMFRRCSEKYLYSSYLRLSSVSTREVFLAASWPSRCCLRSDNTTAIEEIISQIYLQNNNIHYKIIKTCQRFINKLHKFYDSNVRLEGQLDKLEESKLLIHIRPGPGLVCPPQAAWQMSLYIITG